MTRIVDSSCARKSRPSSNGLCLSILPPSTMTITFITDITHLGLGSGIMTPMMSPQERNGGDLVLVAWRGCAVSSGGGGKLKGGKGDVFCVLCEIGDRLRFFFGHLVRPSITFQRLIPHRFKAVDYGDINRQTSFCFATSLI